MPDSVEAESLATFFLHTLFMLEYSGLERAGRRDLVVVGDGLGREVAVNPPVSIKVSNV